MCEEYFLIAPGFELKEEVLFSGKDKDRARDPLTIAYIPSHLHHMAFELFKNAMRATVEHHGKNCETLPPVRATISQGPNEVSIKVECLILLHSTIREGKEKKNKFLREVILIVNIYH